MNLLQFRTIYPELAVFSDPNSPTYVRRSKTGKMSIVRKGKRKKKPNVPLRMATLAGGYAAGIAGGLKGGMMLSNKVLPAWSPKSQTIAAKTAKAFAPAIGGVAGGIAAAKLVGAYYRKKDRGNSTRN